MANTGGASGTREEQGKYLAKETLVTAHGVCLLLCLKAGVAHRNQLLELPAVAVVLAVVG